MGRPKMIKAQKSWRRHVLFVLCLAVACTRPSVQTPSKAEIAIEDSPRRDNVPVILVAMPFTADTVAVRGGLRDEVEADFDIVTLKVTSKTKPEDIARAVDAAEPTCVILMNNATVRLYAKYQQSIAAGTSPPAVIVMTSFLQDVYDQVQNATGIAYEVPAVTMIVNLRAYLDRPVEKVGVIYRPGFARYLREQTQLAKMEKIEIVGIEIPNKPTNKHVRVALAKLRKVEKVDALWVLNDNDLLASRSLVKDGWMAELPKSNVPVVVGVASLVNKHVQFGTFAMLPDHTALGVQAANTIYDLSDADWNLDGARVEQPLSIKTVINLRQARKKFRFREEMLSRIDFVVE